MDTIGTISPRDVPRDERVPGTRARPCARDARRARTQEMPRRESKAMKRLRGLIGRTLAARRRTTNGRTSWNSERVFPERVARALTSGSDADVFAALQSSRDARLICVGFAIATRSLSRTEPVVPRRPRTHEDETVALLMPELDAATRSVTDHAAAPSDSIIAALLADAPGRSTGPAAAAAAAGAAAAAAAEASADGSDAVPVGSIARVSDEERAIALATAALLRAPPAGRGAVGRRAEDCIAGSSNVASARLLRRFVTDTFRPDEEMEDGPGASL